ncbi:MAG TPA: 30S ribosomal protein S4 [Candidatus Paceibacterota bacterium]|nr:30S ribosomal protein S4 [Candidatus Paceibacterota bacterium]
MQKLKQYKICRRLGTPIFEKCQTQKFTRTVSQKTGRPKNVSTYGLQLLEKQKTRFSYGIREGQLAKYVEESLAGSGSPVTNLFQKLELRLDNAVYRMGLAKTRRQARQEVSHGHFLVNGKKVRVASAHLKVGDTIAIRPASFPRGIFTNLDKRLKDYHLPPWLEFDINSLQGKVIGKPLNKEGILDLSAVLEFYSR